VHPYVLRTFETKQKSLKIAIFPTNKSKNRQKVIKSRLSVNRNR